MRHEPLATQGGRVAEGLPSVREIGEIGLRSVARGIPRRELSRRLEPVDVAVPARVALRIDDAACARRPVEGADDRADVARIRHELEVHQRRAVVKLPVAVGKRLDRLRENDLAHGGALVGDVTGDGVINVGDLTALITMVMNDYADKDDKFTAGDMNADGILNVGDITSLVSMIMSASAKAQDAADEIEAAADANTLYVPALENVKANSKDAVMSVEMVNADAISAFQFDLETPSGISVLVEDDFLAVELSTVRTTAKKHVVESQAQKDGSVRVLLYSNKNYDFSGNSGEVCTIGLEVGAVANGVYDCTLKNIALSTASSVVFTPANVTAKIGVGVSVGINDVKVDAENGTYYNLKGQKVSAAQKGVNIVKYNDKAIKVVK